MQDKLISFLGICKKAGKLSIGNDAVLKSVKNNQSKLILFSSDSAENTISKITTVSKMHGVNNIFLNRSKEDISFIFNKPCAVLSINDEGFAKKIRELITEEENII